jgi:hypothetical protein
MHNRAADEIRSWMQRPHRRHLRAAAINENGVMTALGRLDATAATHQVAPGSSATMEP